MICDKCKKNTAVYHERIIHNGIISELYLCKQCKSDSGIQQNALGVIKNIISAFGDMPINDARAAVGRTAVKCPKCGCTSGEYLDTGFVGCPNCYNVFAPMISVAVKRLQKATKHIGKAPDKKSAAEVEIAKLMRLREDAVTAEDFMLAQELTNKINELKGGQKQ